MIIRTIKAGFRIMEMNMNRRNGFIINGGIKQEVSIVKSHLHPKICMWTSSDNKIGQGTDNIEIKMQQKDIKIEQKIDATDPNGPEVDIVKTGKSRKRKAKTGVVRVKGVKGLPYFTVKGDYLMKVFPKETRIKPTSGFQQYRAQMIQTTYKGEFTVEELLLCWHYVNQWKRLGRKRGRPNQTEAEREAREDKAIYGDMVNKYKFLEKCGQDFGKLQQSEQQKWNRKAHAINKETQPKIQKYMFPKLKFKNRKQMKDHYYPINPQNNEKPIVTNEQQQQLQDKFIQMMNDYDEQLTNWLSKFELSLQEFKKMRAQSVSSMQKQKKQGASGKNRSQKRKSMRRHIKIQRNAKKNSTGSKVSKGRSNSTSSSTKSK